MRDKITAGQNLYPGSGRNGMVLSIQLSAATYMRGLEVVKHASLERSPELPQDMTQSAKSHFENIVFAGKRMLLM